MYILLTKLKFPELRLFRQKEPLTGEELRPVSKRLGREFFLPLQIQSTLELLPF